MGLDYSILTFIKKEKVLDAFDWLFINSWGEENEVQFDDKIIKLKGSFSRKITNDSFDFTATLIFDIDPQIINSLYYEFVDFRLELFKEDFINYYLGEGKIRVGGFDSYIEPIKGTDIYKVQFRAVTTDMSLLLVESESIHTWIQIFSEVSESILTCINKEHDEYIIYYENGTKTLKVMNDKSYITDYIIKNYN